MKRISISGTIALGLLLAVSCTQAVVTQAQSAAAGLINAQNSKTLEGLVEQIKMVQQELLDTQLQKLLNADQVKLENIKNILNEYGISLGDVMALGGKIADLVGVILNDNIAAKLPDTVPGAIGKTISDIKGRLSTVALLMNSSSDSLKRNNLQLSNAVAQIVNAQNGKTIQELIAQIKVVQQELFDTQLQKLLQIDQAKLVTLKNKLNEYDISLENIMGLGRKLAEILSVVLNEQIAPKLPASLGNINTYVSDMGQVSKNIADKLQAVVSKIQ